ncbi:hypothetical protein TRFO_34038 [Tritrichomonas foetus]|uniref:non-specific serine/threonine protein kinase n=1 Tax=Tritrichomonas foetus TaxID=1144522 RepID=A0A1J4JPT8_9EUKA|nr:hypothetical protein TRFO_34038 [Tritrichomonas foetus]|eukprot:OHS99531.1 hypothetical protein TRFO_34038 [Tritrichomonas foetus]
MNEINRAICGAQIDTYDNWKTARRNLIKAIHPILMTLSENSINSIFDLWASQTKKKSEPQNRDSILHILLIIALISYFHRDHDSIKPLIPLLNKLIQSEDELIANVTSKLLKLISVESIEGSFLFIKAFSFIKAFFQSKKQQINALYILKRARKVAPPDVIHFTYQSLDLLFDLAIGDNLTKKSIALKLIRFLLQGIKVETSKELFLKFRKLISKNIKKSVPVISHIYEAHSLIFSQDNLDSIYNLVFDDDVTDESLELLVFICEKSQFKLDCNAVTKIIIKHNNISLLSRTINCFKKHIDPNIIIPYLEEICPTHICHENTNCPYVVLKTVLNYFPDIQINTEKFQLCENFIQCIAIRNDFFDISQIDKFVNYLSNPSDNIIGLRHSLMLFRIMRTHFPKNPFLQLQDLLMRSPDIYFQIRVELIKASASIIEEDETAKKIIKLSLLYDPDKKIRLLSLSYLKPDTKIMLFNDMIQLLQDSSFKIRRRAIKLCSEMAKLNPFEMSPTIQLYTNQITDLLCQTPDFRISAKNSSLLSVLCKYCKDIIEPFANVIIEKIFSLLDTNNIILRSKDNTQVDNLSFSDISKSYNSRNSNFNSGSNTVGSSTASSNSTASGKTVITNASHSHFTNSSMTSSVDSSYSNPKRFSVDLHSSLENLNSSYLGLIHADDGSTNEYVKNDYSIFLKSNANVLACNLNSVHSKLSISQPNENEPLKSKLYAIMNEDLLDIRDANLCRALAYLGMLAEPYSTQILNIFCHLFETRKNVKLLISLVKSLRIFCSLIYNGLNIRLRCPQIAVPLSRILANSQSEKLSLSIIKLFGYSFDTILASQSQSSFVGYDSLFINSTDFVIDNILTYFKKPSLPLFAALTMIIEGDPQNSAKYLNRIIPLFISSINKSAVFRDTLFAYLNIIASKCHTDINQLLPTMIPTILKFLNLRSCVKFCIVLSYMMKSSLIPYAVDLYIPAISEMSTNNEYLFKPLVKFITYMIIFQNQPFELFMNKVEREHYSQGFLKIVSNNLITLVQVTDISMYQSRILLFTREYFDPQLLFSLVVYSHLPPQQLKKRFIIVDDSDEKESGAPRYSYLYYNKFQPSNTYFETNMPLPSDQTNQTGTNMIDFQNKNPSISCILNFNSSNFDGKNFDQSSDIINICDCEKTHHSLKNYYNSLNLSISSYQNSVIKNIKRKLEDSTVELSCTAKPTLLRSIFEKLLNFQNYSKDELSFIIPRNPHVKIRSMTPQEIKTETYFSRFTCPSEINVVKWLISLYQHLVKRSPEKSIRSCISLTSFNEAFMQTLFPAAFLSCWRETLESDRIHFSQIVIKILQTYRTIPQLIFDIIILCDRAQLPMKIDIPLIALKSKSHQAALYFTEKYLLESPDNMKAIDMMMTLFLKMGFTLSIRDLFYSVQDKLNNSMVAKWSGWIGNWEKSLEIYTKERANFPTIINCMAKLNKFEDISANFEKFESLDKEGKNEVADAFFIAYQQLNNNEKVQEIIDSYEGQWTPYRFILAINFYIATNQFSKASVLTKKALQMMVNERDVFVSGDQIRISNILNSIQLFIDCKQVLNIKKLNKNTIWKQRIKGFTRDAVMWEQIINLKNNVVPIDSNLSFYMNIISSLRKERHFDLIDRYFKEALLKTQNPHFFIMTLKILWTKGEKEKAAKNAKYINRVINGLSFEEFKSQEYFSSPSRYLMKAEESSHFTNEMREFCCSKLNTIDYVTFADKFQNLPFEEQEKIFMEIHDKFTTQLFKCFIDIRNYNLSYTGITSRMNRITGIYLYKTSDTIQDTNECVQCFAHALKAIPNDYRNWKNWGYSNVRLYHLLKEAKPNLVHETLNGASLLNNNENQFLLDELEIGHARNNSQIYTIHSQESQELALEKFRGSAPNLAQISPLDNSKLVDQASLDTSNEIRNDDEIQKSDIIDDIPNEEEDSNDDMIIEDEYNPYKTVVGCLNRKTPKSVKTKFEARSLNLKGDDNLMILPTCKSVDNISDLSTSNDSVDDTHDNISILAINAITGFLKAAKLNPKNSLEYLCQMFTVLFNLPSSDVIPQTVIAEIQSLPSQTLSKVIPQLTAKIAHPDFLIRNLVRRLILEIGKTQFQSLFFTLQLYSRIKGDKKAEIALEMLSKMKEQNINVYNDAVLFSDGIIRSAVTWFEGWLHSIEYAAKSQKMGDYDYSIRILEERFEDTKTVKCELDRLFIKLFGDELREIYKLFQNSKINRQNNSLNAQSNNPTDSQNNLINSQSNNAENNLWAKLRILHTKLKGQIDRLSVIVLSKISEPLASRHGFNLSIPGSDFTDLYENSTKAKTFDAIYHQFISPDSSNSTGINQNIEKIESVEPIMEIMGTQQKPRVVYIHTTFGRRVKYLLKGNEDLRLDERLMQFFLLVNENFRQDRFARRYQISVNRYSIVPLTTTSGLIQWVTGADTVHQIICDYRKYKRSPVLPENDILKENTNIEFINLNSLQRYEMFVEVSKKCPANEIFEWMWIKAPSPHVWMTRNERYTISMALMSIVGYIIGLGDRHPSNIMIQRDTGNIVHIDFGESFESAIRRSAHPEKVPFRLTRMLSKNLSGNKSVGFFKYVAQNVMDVLQESKSSLVSQLAIFIHEPLNDSGNKHLLKRVENKLEGKDFKHEGIPQLGLVEQVDKLINIAEDPMNYVRHYPGWCPFW